MLGMLLLVTFWQQILISEATSLILGWAGLCYRHRISRLDTVGTTACGICCTHAG